MSDVNGKFLWYELMTTDPDPAADFYGKIVGWGTMSWEGADVGTPYTMFTNGEVPMCGLMELPEEARAQGAPPHWLPYIGTPDTDATVEKATSLGANVLVAPMSVPEVGRMAVLQDPQGAVFACYTPENPPPGHEGPPKVGEMSWHELLATDWEAAWAFYSELFDWNKTDAMDMGEAGIYQMYGQGEQSFGGIFTKPDEVPGPAHWLIYAFVDDVTAKVETVKELGGTVLNGPMEVPGGSFIAQCIDPQGAAFAINSAGNV